MTTWRVTDNDRGPDGRIKASAFDDEVARALRDVGAEPTAPLSPEGERTRAPVEPLTRSHLAVGLALAALAVALVALARSPAPPVDSHPAAVPPTAAPANTPAPSATPVPTVTPQPTATTVPTEAPALVAPEPTDAPPCTDDRAVARLSAPEGSVFSCVSLEDAQQRLATVIAISHATPTP